jgi:hypothetical protein
MMTSCDKKASQPEDTFNVTNENAHCGLVAGLVRNTSGAGLSGATVTISPARPSRMNLPASVSSLSSFYNYPNPFTSDTYFAYYLTGTDQHTMTISVYNLNHELLRQFHDAPGTEGAHLYHFDGLDTAQEPLPEGLFPCRIVVQGMQETDSLFIALSKNVNISDEGGLTSYTTFSAADGQYIIADVPLNILLQATTTFAPDLELSYPENWPYVETGWTLSDHFIVSASKTGYAVVSDTVTLNPGGVTRLDMALP